MSGETETDVSGWSTDTLRAHLIRELQVVRELIDERDIRYQQRYDASQKALDAALLSADRAVQAALLAAKEAVTKAELAADKRFELLNELRTGVATVEQIDALEKVVGDLARRLDLGEGRTSGGRERLTGIYAALAGAVALIAVIVFAARFVS